MRVLRSALLAALAAGLTACVNHASSPPPSQAAWALPPAYQPAQPAPWPAGLPRLTTRPAGAPAGAFGLAPTPAAPSWPVNVAALLGLQAQRCAPKQVAPGEWVTFDCGGFRPVTRVFALAPRMSLVSGPLPPSVDHRAEGSEGPIKTQGAVGACTAFSLSTAMDNALRRMGRQDVIAPLHVWSKYAVPIMGTAGDDTVDQSITLEPIWPYDPAKACKLTRTPDPTCSSAYGVTAGSASADPKLKAEQATADASGRYRLVSIEQLPTRPTNIDDVAAVLAGGDDLWVSFLVNDEAWSNRTANSSLIPDYTVNDDTGHAVVLAGYRTLANGQRQFLVHNSWGPRWGENGYGWISQAMVAQYMRSAYKIKVADAGSPVSPAPPPSAGGCADGKVKDAVLGTCTSVCASGSAPAAGVCLPTVPGFPAPGQIPIPGIPGNPLPAPSAPSQSKCGNGQAPDMMTGQCQNLCPGGMPPFGGMCLPIGR